MPELTCRGLDKHSTLASGDGHAPLWHWLDRNGLHGLSRSLCWLGLHAWGGVLRRVGLHRLLWGRYICGQGLYYLHGGRSQTDWSWWVSISIAASLNWGYPGRPNGWLGRVRQGTGSQVPCQAVLQILRGRLAKHPQVIQGADGLSAVLI